MADLNAIIAHITQALTLPSPLGDGTNGSHGSLTGTGDTYDYLTYPKTPSVNVGAEWSGTISYPYDCRERHKHYVAQVETGTSDSNFSGVVNATIDIMPIGKVFISNINNQGKRGNSGNSIESHLQSLNASILG
jgi:hypothetical protein